MKHIEPEEDIWRAAITEFLIESAGMVQRVECDLLPALEDGAPSETFDRIFRTFHTIKGTAGCLGFWAIAAASHDLETCLVEWHHGERHTDEWAHALSLAVEGVRAMIHAEMARRAETAFGVEPPVVVSRDAQPLMTIWRRLPPLAHALADQLGKQLRVEMHGGAITAAAPLLQAIRDPLTHLVRNAVVHGIESPDVRRKRGKPVEGVVRVNATRANAALQLDVSDDGAGLDPQQMRARAVALGCIPAEIAAGLSDREAQRLILLTGFSTAATVTMFAGRGIGLDVVRVNLETVGGWVEVSSQIGRGTTMTLTVPT